MGTKEVTTDSLTWRGKRLGKLKSGLGTTSKRFENDVVNNSDPKLARKD